MQRIKYRLRYWLRRAVASLGRCPECLERVNFTGNEIRLCPYCGKSDLPF